MAYIKNPEQAVSYSKFRPTPSLELINKIVDFARQKADKPLGVALDIGCGSGQSTEVLAPFFQTVIGVDNSKEQLQQAQNNVNKNTNVFYRLGSAEDLEEDNESVAVVTVGQAVHWFDLQRFSKEVGRVLQPGGVLAIYGYGLPSLVVNGVCLGDIVQLMIENSLGQYFPKGSNEVYFENYTEERFSKFPFSTQPATRFVFQSTKKNACILDLMGYISSMSGFQNYMKEQGEASALALLSGFKSKIAEHLTGDTNIEETEVEITFPYFLLLTRKDIL